MQPSAVSCVRHIIDEYRRFLKTSYRFLDPHLREQFERHLTGTGVVVKGPYVTLSRDFVRGRTLKALVEEGLAEAGLLEAKWPFGGNPLYRHQEQAHLAGRSGHSFVVTTGTGSGKTESFLLPVLNGILQRKRSGIQGVQAVFLYPMNALANDQLERLRRMLRGSPTGISFALYTGDSDVSTQALREAPAETERLTRAQIRQNPPDILLTNYKQLEFLLVRAEDRILFTPALHYLVLDELHSYRGALATEIAALIRRLKVHAEISPEELICIGTSATVAAGEGSLRALADFATTLFGTAFDTANIIEESLVPLQHSQHPWVPPTPCIAKGALGKLDWDDAEAVIQFSEALSGRTIPDEGPIARRISKILEGNAIVQAIEQVFAEPALLSDAVEMIRSQVAERADVADAELLREVEAYLLAGSVADEAHPPRLRPKLHSFFHGIYDVALCLNPNCRTLVPHGAAECTVCGSAARPAALCRTCGQDFVKVKFSGSEDDRPVGSGDFFSDENTGFLTSRLHELPEEDEDQEAPPSRARGNGRRQGNAARDRLRNIHLCVQCGRVMQEPGRCPGCNVASVPYLLHTGPLRSCPACGDTYGRWDIVTPLRTGTASTVSAIATHHLDHLPKDDRKLLVFADNRQDVAHQAGYTSDKHRTFAMRHIIAHQVREAGEDGLYLEELSERLLDEYRRLGIIIGRLNQAQYRKWREALTFQAISEFTRYTRQRASLENLGIVAVEYEWLEELQNEAGFHAAASAAGLDTDTALTLVRAVLDVMRQKRAVAHELFQQYIDPNRKRRFRELENEPYNIRFPDRDRGPKGFALNRPGHIRQSRSGSILGFFQENPRAGQLTAVQKVVARVVGDRTRAQAFLEAIVPILEDDKTPMLVKVDNFPLPAADRTPGLRIMQINLSALRLVAKAEGFRCNACKYWRAYPFTTCPTPKCRQGILLPDKVDSENYYVRLYTDRPPQRLKVMEHSAQIDGEERANRETAFKGGRLEALVCTPTLELGVDIGDLLTVVLRNAPPTPANYIQRVGRAGRRLRIGYVSTFCAGGVHDRHAFEHPSWLLHGNFMPPRLRLDNPRVVHRHLRSFILESVHAQLPKLMGELLDDVRSPNSIKLDMVQTVCDEVNANQQALVDRLESLFAPDRGAERTTRYGNEECRDLISSFQADLQSAIHTWWERVKQLDTEYKFYANIGSPSHDQKKANARRRAYYEITQDKQRAYALNYLSTQGLLPAYQFPIDTFHLDPGVADTPTIHRKAAVALEEFAPGNFVYANGHKLKSIRVLFAGGPGASRIQTGRSDAEATGRLRSFQFCEHCDEVVEEVHNSCPRCNNSMPSATDCIFVDAFEAEESIRIGSDEESRQRQFFMRKERLIGQGQTDCRLFPYPFAPVEYRRLSNILITNWGRADVRTGEPNRFRLCPDCGRHMDLDIHNPAQHAAIERWRENHGRSCSGEPVPLVLAYEFQSDCLILNVPAFNDMTVSGKVCLSPSLVTLTEALVGGAADLLELEPYEIAGFPRLSPQTSGTDEIVFYETVPGGAGYVEEMARRMPEVAEAARQRLYDHPCIKGCYICLKHYFNQRWHAFLDKSRIQDILFQLSRMEPVEPMEGKSGIGSQTLNDELKSNRDRFQSEKAPGTGGPQSPIEEVLLEAIRKHTGLPEPVSQFEYRAGEKLVTIPDFAYPDQKIAVFCDGYAYHGNADTLELDAKKRNEMQANGWVVLTFWGRTINKDPLACVHEINSIYQARAR
jgi:hypothetical protein